MLMHLNFMNANIETEITHFALFNLFLLFKILSAHSSHQQSTFNEKNQLCGKSRVAYIKFLSNLSQNNMEMPLINIL